MIDHVSIGVRNLLKAKRFYDAALKPLGLRCLSEGDGSLGYGRESIGLLVRITERPVQPDEKSGLHICFSARDVDSVVAFHEAALAAGGGDNGAPGLHPDYEADYFAAYIIHPDGIVLRRIVALQPDRSAAAATALRHIGPTEEFGTTALTRPRRVSRLELVDRTSRAELRSAHVSVLGACRRDHPSWRPTKFPR